MDIKGSKINVVKNWLRNKETISFLDVLEEINNENFKVIEFDQFKNETGRLHLPCLLKFDQY